MGAISAKLKQAKTQQDNEVDSLIKSSAQLKKVWKDLDFNGNGNVSLAEIDKMIVANGVPALRGCNNKPALLRAYRKTTKKDGNGDAYVQPRELPALLQNIYYFNKLWKIFSTTGGADRRMELAEFKVGVKKMGIKLNEQECSIAFNKMDRNGGGQVLFDEFCRFYAQAASGTPITLEVRPPTRQQQQQKKKRQPRQPQLSPIENLAKNFGQMAGGKGWIQAEELGTVLQRSGIAVSRAEYLELADVLDTNEDGRIGKQEFMKYFTQKLAPRNNAKYNRMLIKPTIGQAKSSSYNLPASYHTYGNKVSRDPEGAGPVIFGWAGFEPTSIDERKLNILKMNKQAIQRGHTSPKAMARYNKTHKVYDRKTLSGSKSREQMLADNRKLTDPSIRSRTFGITARAGTPISDLITGSFVPASDDASYPLMTAADNRRKKKQNAKRFDSSKPTKASLGHAQARARLAAANEPKQGFKMKRFANVKSRLGSAGNRIASR